MCRPPGARVEASAAGFPAVAPSSAGRKLLGEKLGPAAGVCESCNDRQHVLIAALTSEARLHSPDGEERPRWDAVSDKSGRHLPHLHGNFCCRTLLWDLGRVLN